MRSSTSARPFGRVIATATTMALVAAAAIAVVGLSAPAALATSNTPPSGSHVPGPGCGTYQGTGFWAEGATPSLVNSGDYTGNVVYGNTSTPACLNATAYILDVAGNATSTFVWEYGANQSSSVNVQGDNCSAWAYIPTVDAGDQHARYDMWGVTSTGVRHWLSWPGHTVDQETTSGWIYLGSATTGGYATFAVTLTNSDPTSPGWYTGAGAMAISCTPVAAQVPTGVTATATGPDTIQVKWSDPSGGNNKFVVTNDVTSTAQLTYGTTSYTWGGLVPGTYMCFAVQAVNSAGTSSAWSSPWACAVTLVAPPTNVTATPNTAKVHISWTDTSGGAASFVVSNGNVSSPTLPPGTTSYDWTGLAVGTYMCFTVTAKQGDGQSPWTPYACATTTTGSAARDSFITTLQNAVPVQYGMTDATSAPMDTAKIIQVGQTYYAVYSPHSQGIWLASAPSLYSTWTPIVQLDDSNASQPYLAQMSDSSFVLVDEYVTNSIVPHSNLHFKRYASPAALVAGQSDNAYLVTDTSLSACHQGTPDIHSTDPANIQVGFHYDSDCLNTQLDQEAFGTLTGFGSNQGIIPAWTETADTVRDAALNNAHTPWTNPSGYPGKHGGRDDVWWQGNRYSLNEAQNSSQTSLFTNWRLALYDYSNHTAYPIVLNIPPTCAANPKVTPVTDSTTGKSVLVITAFIPSSSTSPCAQPGEGGEVEYVIPAQ